MLRKLGESFSRQLWLAACNKNVFLKLLHISRDNKAKLFSTRFEVFIWKIKSRSCLDPALRERDPAWLGRMKNVPASYKCNNWFMKKWLKSSDLVYFPALLIIPSRVSYKQPLDLFFFKALIKTLSVVFVINLFYTFITQDRRKSKEQRPKSNKQCTKNNEQQVWSETQWAKTKEQQGKYEQRAKTNENRPKTNKRRAMSRKFSLYWLKYF